MILRMILVGLCGGSIAATVTFFAARRVHHHRSYSRGLKEGYELGRKSADDWWIGVERQTEEERRRIWRESA